MTLGREFFQQDMKSTNHKGIGECVVADCITLNRFATPPYLFHLWEIIYSHLMSLALANKMWL